MCHSSKTQSKEAKMVETKVRDENSSVREWGKHGQALLEFNWKWRLDKRRMEFSPLCLVPRASLYCISWRKGWGITFWRGEREQRWDSKCSNQVEVWGRKNLILACLSSSIGFRSDQVYYRTKRFTSEYKLLSLYITMYRFNFTCFSQSKL